MAIYQYLLIAIPRKGIIDKYGYIPNKLIIDYQERSEYFLLKKEGLLEGHEIYNDALLQKWWISTKINPMEIIHQIDKIIKRSNYSKDQHVSWKYYTAEADNDASLSFNEDTGTIEELRFRADLRENNLRFLHEMIDLSLEHDFMLMDMNGNLTEPVFSEVAKLVKTSNAFKFLENPLQFFDDIDNGTIKVE
jgi:hypothetical protein